MTRPFRKSPVRLLADARRLNLRSKATGAAWAELTASIHRMGYTVDHDSEVQVLLTEICEAFGMDCPSEWAGWSLGVREK